MSYKIPAALVLAVLIAAAPATAQEWRERVDAALSRKATYDLQDRVLEDVVRLLAKDFEINIIVDDARAASGLPQQKLTLRLRDMTLAGILTWVTRMTGLEWCVQDEAIFISSYAKLDSAARLQVERRILDRRLQAPRTWLPAMQKVLENRHGVTFTQTNIVDCRDRLQAIFGVNILLSPSVNPRTQVTLAVSNMTAENILSWVVRKASLDFAVMDEAIYIAPAPELRAARLAGIDFSARGRAYDLVTFDFADTAVAEALATLEQQTGTRIELRSDVEPLPLVTVSGKDMALTAAIQAIANATGLNNAIQGEADIITVRLMRRPAPLRPVEALPPPEAAPPQDAPQPGLSAGSQPGVPLQMPGER